MALGPKIRGQDLSHLHSVPTLDQAKRGLALRALKGACSAPSPALLLPWEEASVGPGHVPTPSVYSDPVI